MDHKQLQEFSGTEFDVLTARLAAGFSARDKAGVFRKKAFEIVRAPDITDLQVAATAAAFKQIGTAALGAADVDPDMAYNALYGYRLCLDIHCPYPSNISPWREEDKEAKLALLDDFVCPKNVLTVARAFHQQGNTECAFEVENWYTEDSFNNIRENELRHEDMRELEKFIWQLRDEEQAQTLESFDTVLNSLCTVPPVVSEAKANMPDVLTIQKLAVPTPLKDHNVHQWGGH